MKVKVFLRFGKAVEVKNGVLDGSTLRIGNETYKVDPQHIFFINVRRLHRVKSIPAVIVDRGKQTSIPLPGYDKKDLVREDNIKLAGQIRLHYYTSTLLREEREKIRKMMLASMIGSFIVIAIAIGVFGYVIINTNAMISESLHELSKSLLHYINVTRAPPI